MHQMLQHAAGMQLAEQHLSRNGKSLPAKLG
jgi:hypothetical protein